MYSTFSAGMTCRSPLKRPLTRSAEILSPSTARYDVVKKQRTYHLHGVPHYWLLDPTHETLTVLRHTAEGYLQVLTATIGDAIRAEPFDGIEISVSDLFGRE